MFSCCACHFYMLDTDGSMTCPLTLNVGGELYASYEIISVTSTTAELKMSMDGEAIWIKCKKE